MSSGGEKRRRVSSSVTSRTTNIDNLSDEILMHIANYLPKTSVALFATIFSSLNDSEPSATSKTIISSYNQTWECIDFLDVDKDLRMKLSDNDIEGLLFCIDAVNNLKKLKLTHCFNFTGKGLQQIVINGEINKARY